MIVKSKDGRRRIVADDEILEDDVDMVDEGAGEEFPDGGSEEDIVVAPEASELLFEAEDVAELVAEITGEAVEVTAEEDTVTFAVGEDEFVVEAEGDEEVLEAIRKPLRGKRTVSASRKVNRPAPRKATAKRPVKASTAKKAKTITKVPSSRKR